MNITNITLYSGTNNVLLRSNVVAVSIFLSDVFMSSNLSDKYVYRTVVVSLMQSRSGVV